MLKRRAHVFIIANLSIVLMLSGCTNKALPWRSSQLVAQLYRQYKQELLLAYNDFNSRMTVDEQRGYARAYFDDYRKQIIFTKERTLDYLIDGKVMSTSTAEIKGYPSDILINETYQLAIEILNVRPENFESDEFDGAKSRIIDLNTGANVIVDGLLFNRCLIVGDYFYGFTFDNEYNQLFDIINLKTMEHRRTKRISDKITFIYEMGDKVYIQVANEQTVFLLDGFDMHEKHAMYDAQLPNFEHSAQVLKDIASRDAVEHWYIEPPETEQFVKQTRLFRMQPDGEIKVLPIEFAQKDIIQIMDVASYNSNQIAFFLMTKDTDGDLHAIISVFDLQGKETHKEEITDLLHDDAGRFTYLDYVE